MDLEQRIARLEAESQIRQLISRYCFTIDDRLIEENSALFAPDAKVRSADGVMNSKGVDAIKAMYAQRFAALGPGAHYMHDLQLDFVGDDLSEARGRVSGHAELERNGQMMVCSIRYKDEYRKFGDRWLFQDREISFLYYVSVAEYPGILLQSDRNRAYEENKLADFPESLPSWSRPQD